MVKSQASRPEPQGGVNVTVVESVPVRITQCVKSQASRPEPQGGVNVTVVESVPVRITQMSLIKESHRPTDKIHKQVYKETKTKAL